MIFFVSEHAAAILCCPPSPNDVYLPSRTTYDFFKKWFLLLFLSSATNAQSHSGIFNEFYYCLKFTCECDKKMNSSNHGSLILKLSVLLSFDDFFFLLIIYEFQINIKIRQNYHLWNNPMEFVTYFLFRSGFVILIITHTVYLPWNSKLQVRAWQCFVLHTCLNLALLKIYLHTHTVKLHT